MNCESLPFFKQPLEYNKLFLPLSNLSITGQTNMLGNLAAVYLLLIHLILKKSDLSGKALFFQ